MPDLEKNMMEALSLYLDEPARPLSLFPEFSVDQILTRR